MNMSNACKPVTLYGRSGKIVAPACMAHELLQLDMLGVRVIGASCYDQVIWVEDENADDLLALGYEPKCSGSVFKAMSKLKEDCEWITSLE